MKSDSSETGSLPSSLLDGVEKAVVDLLGITSTRHRSALLKLGAVDGPALVELVFRQIRVNYDIAGSSARKNRSRENWRWQSLQPQIAPHNRSPEVAVERAIAAACARMGRTDWANQVPVASGLMDGASGGRRAIDLVRRRGERHFEFIELKIDSDTPLYAAVEIIGYACPWIIAKGDRPAHASAILDSERVDLRVLAPADYYSSFALSALNSALNNGVSALGLRHGVTLSFAFEQLDARIKAVAMLSDDELLNCFDHNAAVNGVLSKVTGSLFLPGVPEDYVRERLEKAGGDEISSGKFANPQSSAALAANAFGWFVPRPTQLPTLPDMAYIGPPQKVEIEYCARFPWPGGRHPWLDAAIITKTHLVGIESKRFEPFRDAKNSSFAPAYDRPVWGDRMERYGALRDALRSGALRYRHLDAAQLVKHAYGLITEGRRLLLKPCLYYVYAEPTTMGTQTIPAEAHSCHRSEIADFKGRISGDEVEFGAASYLEWLVAASGETIDHKDALIARFDP
jgi:hypothetical protein